LGIFSELIAQITSRASVSAGFRHDDNDDSGEHTSARVAGAYIQSLNAHSRLKYRSSFGTGFRAPSLFEISYNAGPFAFGEAANTLLVEEQSEGFDLGVEYYHDLGLRLELNYFHQRIENEIFFDTLAFSGYLQSEGESRSKGLEFSYELSVTQWLSLLGNYTFNQTRSNDNTVRPRRPEKMANIGLQWSLFNSRLRMLANMRISRDAKEFDGSLLDDYQILDISANFDANERVKIFARVENANDENYQEISGFNTAKAAFYAGASVEF